MTAATAGRLIRIHASMKLRDTTLVSVQQLYVTDAARSIPGPPDAVGLVRVNINPSMIRLRIRQRKFGERLGFGIEPGDLVHVLFAKPKQFALWISLHRVDAGIFGRRRIYGHLQSLVINLHELARAMQADPDIALRVPACLARDGVFHRYLKLVDLARNRVHPA